jgi:hypothetical protein
MEPTIVTLQTPGFEYTLHVEFDVHRASIELLGRVIRNKSHVAHAVSGALKVKLIAKVPLK